MPVMDGPEATRSIRAGRAGEAALGAPSAATTVVALQNDRHRVVDAGALPDVLPGFDLTLMKTRLGADTVLLLHILRYFATDFQDWEAQYEAASAAGDHKLMVRLAHTLKGTAASVCAQPVQAAAEALEAALLRGSAVSVAPECFSACQVTLRQALATLATLPPAVSQAQTPSHLPASQSSARDVLVDIQIKLRQSKRIPSAQLEQLRAVLGNSVPADLIDTLLRQVGAFNFKDALKTLAILEESWVLPGPGVTS